MAKKTTAGKRAAAKGSAAKRTPRQAKPADDVEEAQVIEEKTAPEDTPAVADPDTSSDATPETDEDTAEARPDEVSEATEGSLASDMSDKPVSEETSHEEPRPAAPPAAAQQDQFGGGAVPLIFGGVIAGAIGFGVAYLLGDKPETPAPVDLSGIEQSIEAQTGRIDELAAAIPDASAATDLSSFQSELSVLSEVVIALDTRMAALESREPTASGVAPADPALREDLEALKSTIAALEAENETAKANARSAAEATLKRAAMTQVQTALESGVPFSNAVAELAALGVELPAALSDAAENGVTTLSSLQESFPDAARTALAADRQAAADSGETGGLTGFLRSQLGARSLTPQEGDGTDAVLSRAEAALREGRLMDALGELDTLPDVAQPAMAAWAKLAKGRADALAAAHTLSDSLN